MFLPGGSTMSSDHASRTLNLVLIKPSRYDDDGYVVRHWRGVLPSNTLAAIYSLTEQVSASTEETSASAQQIAASAQELSTNAEGLNQLVARFKLSA